MHEDFIKADPLIFLEHGLLNNIITLQEYQDAMTVQRIKEKSLSKPKFLYDDRTLYHIKPNI